MNDSSLSVVYHNIYISKTGAENHGISLPEDMMKLFISHGEKEKCCPGRISDSTRPGVTVEVNDKQGTMSGGGRRGTGCWGGTKTAIQPPQLYQWPFSHFSMNYLNGASLPTPSTVRKRFFFFFLQIGRAHV